MTTKPFLRVALATALSVVVPNVALAQQGSATAPAQELDATTVQPDSATGGGMSSEGMPASGMSSGGMAAGGMAAGSAATSVEVGGAAMFSNRTIAENAPNAPNLSTLVAAVQAAGLVETLAGPGPFTVFVPDNAAFAALPAGTVETLLEPANRDQLTAILTYHVVPGALTASQLTNGATLTTVEGSPLTVGVSGGTVTITDESGNAATVSQADVLQSNGVVHVIHGVLMPAM